MTGAGRTVLLAVALSGSAIVSAQQVISVRAGLIRYTEGTVRLGGRAIEPQPPRFAEIGDGRTLTTGAGRAEILLTPGAVLRLGPDSSIRMLSSALTGTRVEILSGSAMVEVEDLFRENAIDLIYRGADIAVEKRGLYRLDAGPGRWRVYRGQAMVTSPGRTVRVRKGQQTELPGAQAVEKFDSKLADAFDRWSARRALAPWKPPPPGGSKELTQIWFPPGIEVPLRVLDEIDAATAAMGDPVRAGLAADLNWNGHLLVPKGTPAMGWISRVEREGSCAVLGVVFSGFDADNLDAPLRLHFERASGIRVRLRSAPEAPSAKPHEGLLVLPPGELRLEPGAVITWWRT
jgi:hypothetical protein